MADQTMQELHALLLGEGRPDPAQLRDLAPVLPEPFLLPAIELANLIENRQLRAQVLVALAARLPEGKREPVLREALAAWEPEVDRVNDGIRVWAMISLLPYLPDVLLDELLAITEGIEEGNSRARALAAIAPHLPEALLSRALAITEGVEEGNSRARALAAIAPHLPEALLSKALATALALPELVYQEDPLSAMVPRLSDTLVQEALGAVFQIGEEGRRARVLVQLAPRLSHPLLVADAFTAARAIENESYWAPVIVALARHLPERLRWEAVAAAREIQASQLRIRTLVYLSPYLAEPLRGEVQREVLAGVRGVDSPNQKAELLSLLVPFTSPPLQYEILAEALASARSIEVKELQAQALAIVAEYLSEPIKEEVQKEALAVAQEIEAESSRAYTLGQLTSYLTERLQAEALAAASAIEEEHWRARALAEMAQHLSRPLQLKALDQARQIGNPLDRMTAFTELEPYVPDALLAEEAEGVRFARSLVMMMGTPGQQESAPRVDERLLAGLAALAEPDQFALLKKYFAGLASRQERVVNTGFAPTSQLDAPVDPAMPLACDEPYFFWLEVGRPVAGSIEETPTSLPVEHLPPEARLTVALFAFENEIQITPGADVGELQLHPDGAVRVVRQPGQLPVSPSAPLSRRLFFPVRTSNRAKTCRLLCHIYYQQVLVQSRLIRVRVMRYPHPVERALRSVVDYTLTRTLDLQHLARIVPHRLSLMLNNNGNGTHGFSFLGEQDFKSDASFDGGELKYFIQQTRGALRQAAWGDELPWEQGKAYRYNGPLNLPQLTKDVARLAIRGYRCWDALINRLAGGRDEADKLAELMRKPGLVQFTLKESARFVVPVALIYDYGFDTTANLSDYTLCSTFQDALNAPGSLEDCSCFKGKCPNQGKYTVICPSGFWGYRHCLGMPLSVATAPDAPLEILYQQRPQLAVGVSTDPVFILRQVHEQALRSLQPGLGWNYGATRDDVFKLLKDTKPHLVYFFCHGGVAKNVPYIQVGAPTERGITRDNLRFKQIRWDDSHPLVFINGCHTTALEPEVALELVSAFVENARASGVVGTEITIFEPLARAFAEECLRRFLSGTSISEAVRGARLALLKAGNPLGLAYIPFAIASLRLDKQPWP
jgi:hypothetical protein